MNPGFNELYRRCSSTFKPCNTASHTLFEKEGCAYWMSQTPEPLSWNVLAGPACHHTSLMHFALGITVLALSHTLIALPCSSTSFIFSLVTSPSKIFCRILVLIRLGCTSYRARYRRWTQRCCHRHSSMFRGRLLYPLPMLEMRGCLRIMARAP